MVLRSVVRVEASRLLRGKTPWVVGTLLVLLSRAPVSPRPEVVDALGAAAPFARVQMAVAALVPFVAAVVAYRSISGDRESGTIRLLAGTRLSRHQLVAGKWAGLTLGLLPPLLVGSVLVVAYDGLRYGSVSFVLALGFLVLTVVYVAAFVGVVVGVSATVSSSVRGAAAVFALVVAGTALWKAVTVPFVLGLVGVGPSGPGGPTTLGALVLERFSTTNSFYVVSNWLFDVPIGPDSAQSEVRNRLGPFPSVRPDSVLLSPWVSLVTLVAWPAVFLALGLARFSRGSLALSAATGDRPWRRLLRRVPIPGRRFGSGVVAAGRHRVSHFADALPGRWQPTARREWRRYRRSPGPWVVGGLVALGGLLSLPRSPSLVVELGANVPLEALQTPLRVFVGFGVLLATFRAVSADLAAGRFRVAGATATPRRSLVLGAVVGRVVAFVPPVVTAILIVCLWAVPSTGVVPLGALLGTLVLVVLFVTAIASIGICVSSLSRIQSVGAALVLVVVLSWVQWPTVLNRLYETVVGVQASGVNPPRDPLFLVARWATPTALFTVGSNFLLGVPNSGASASVVYQDLQPNVFTNIVVVRQVFGTDVPIWYLHPLAGVAALTLWVVVPLALAIYRFERTDL